MITLYQTTINNESGDLSINGVQDENNILIKDYIDKKQNSKVSVLWISIVIVGLSVICVYLGIIIIKKFLNGNKKTN